MNIIFQLEQEILLWIQSIRLEWLTPLWKAITFLGNGGWFWIFLSVFFLLFSQTRKVGGTVLFALIIGALITNVCVKPAVARIRPYEVIEGLIPLINPPMDFSFPSGHSCAAFAAATACWEGLPKKYGIAMLALAGLVSFSRLYLGVHYPSDVAAGIAVGVFAGWLSQKIVLLFFIQKQKRTDSCD